MAKVLSIHIDESVPAFAAIAKGMRERGIEVTTAIEAQLLGAKDSVHLAYSKTHSRVLFTNDPDFLALAPLNPAHAGIIYCRQDKHSIGVLINLLSLYWEVYTDEEMRGRVDFI